MIDLRPEAIAELATQLYRAGVTAPTAPPSPETAMPPATALPSSAAVVMPGAVSGLNPGHAPADYSGLRDFVQTALKGHTGQDPLRGLFERLGQNAGSRPFDVAAVRRDFPALRQTVHGQPLAWLDNAATTQKPQCVIDAVARFYERDNSNIHRAAHTLAGRATDAYESARQKTQRFLNAPDPRNIIFVRGTTEGINLIANSFAAKYLKAGDEIVLTVLEHHAQIVPWQMAAKRVGAVLRVAPVNDRAEIMLSDYEALLGPHTKVVALTHASNSLGTLLPISEMTQAAKRHGARVFIDGAQTVAHVPVDVQSLGCDGFVFSGHKLFAPMGIGAVYLSDEMLELLPPWQGGGNMIRDVTFEETQFATPPAKFEAGTPSVADAVGLGAALDYVSKLGLTAIAQHEHRLLQAATDGLAKIDGVRLLGLAREKVAVLSFLVKDYPPEAVGRALDQAGIAVRSGHHCSQPSLRRFGVEATVRPSFSLYNTLEEVDRLTDAVRHIARSGGRAPIR